jgi:hypothetical protein
MGRIRAGGYGSLAAGRLVCRETGGIPDLYRINIRHYSMLEMSHHFAQKWMVYA